VLEKEINFCKLNRVQICIDGSRMQHRRNSAHVNAYLSDVRRQYPASAATAALRGDGLRGVGFIPR
jgi:hypothetical protein